MGWQLLIKVVTPRWGWALTGSGHFFIECLDLARELVKVLPRRIGLENFEKLESFEATYAAESLSEPKEFLARRGNELTVA